MIESWHRREGPRELDEQAQDMLVRRLWPGQAIGDVEALGGETNANFKLTLDSGASFVLRLYMQGRGGLERERSALAMAGEGVPVPLVVDAEPDGGVLGYPFLITEFIEGQIPGPTMNGTWVQSLARTLCAIGDYAFESPGILGPGGTLCRTFESPRAELEDFFRWSLFEGRAGRRLGPSQAKALYGHLARRLPEFDLLPRRACLVHGDFKLDNILIDTGGSHVNAVLDWEFARAGSPLEDIAALFRQRPGPGSDFEDRFIAAYRSAGGELPDSWRPLLEIYDIKAWCGMLGASFGRKSLIKITKLALLTVIQ